MESTKGKTFEIKDLKQLCNVINDDNIDLLSKDLLKWIFFYNNFVRNIRLKHPDLCKGKSNSEIIEDVSFVWTDDGVNELTEFRLKNKQTGEVSIHEISEKEPEPLKLKREDLIKLTELHEKTIELIHSSDIPEFIIEAILSPIEEVLSDNGFDLKEKDV